MEKNVFSDRRRWAFAYRTHQLTLSMRATQRVEGFFKDVKKDVRRAGKYRSL
jgi:hypothetical protein